MAGRTKDLNIANCRLPIANLENLRQIGNRKLAIGNELQPGGGWFFDDMTVAHLHDTAAHCCRFRIVSDHDDRLVKAVIQFLEHVKDESGVF